MNKVEQTNNWLPTFVTLLTVLHVFINNIEILCYTAVSAPQYYQLHQVIVRVIDINDNDPTFHEHSVVHVLNISEWTPTGTRYSLPVADDMDSEKFAVVEYRLEPSEMQQIFTLDVVTEIDGSQQVCQYVTCIIIDLYAYYLIASYFCWLIIMRATKDTL